MPSDLIFLFGKSFGVLGALEESITLARDYALQRYGSTLSESSHPRHTYINDLVPSHRKQFGAPIASFQLIQKKLAEANMEAAIGLVSAVQLGRLKDSGNWSRTYSSPPNSHSVDWSSCSLAYSSTCSRNGLNDEDEQLLEGN